MHELLRLAISKSKGIENIFNEEDNNSVNETDLNKAEAVADNCGLLKAHSLKHKQFVHEIKKSVAPDFTAPQDPNVLKWARELLLPGYTPNSIVRHFVGLCQPVPHTTPVYLTHIFCLLGQFRFSPPPYFVFLHINTYWDTD